MKETKRADSFSRANQGGSISLATDKAVTRRLLGDKEEEPNQQSISQRRGLSKIEDDIKMIEAEDRQKSLMNSSIVSHDGEETEKIPLVDRIRLGPL